MRRSKYSRRSGESGSFWLSFSDMMSVLVLIFIFVIFSMLYSLDKTKVGLEELRTQYAAAMTELDTSKAEQERLVILLAEQETELETAKAERDSQNELVLSLTAENNSLKTENESLTSENSALSQKYLLLVQDKTMLENSINSLDAQISSLQAQLKQKQTEYDQLAASAAGSSQLISSYESEIASYKKQLEETQRSLETMLGIKTQIIERLSMELARNSISVEVDSQTGAISLSGGALFDTGKTELKEGGTAYLDRVLPVYFSVLMSDEFRPYIAEIVIEGHTDSQGTYISNLLLSQQRAYAVANYVLSEDYMSRVLRLNANGRNELLTLVSASGRSESALKYDVYGREDMNASRRVEIKFRLKDDETIEATRILLGLLSE